MKVLIWCCGFESRFAGQYVATEAKRQGFDVEICGSRLRPQMMLPALYSYKPDVVLCFALRPNFGPFYDMIRKTGAKLVFWYPDMTESRRDHMWRRSLNNVADMIFFSIKETAQRYKDMAKTVLWMPQYFDHRFCFETHETMGGWMRPRRLNPEKEIYDVCFIGSCDKLRDSWLNNLLRYYKCAFSRDGIKRRREVRGVEMAEIYAQSKIAINIQRAMFINVGDYVVSNRIYNAMGSGCFFLNHSVTHLDLVFKEGVHCVSHNDTIRDVRSKIDYYLAHDKEREQIAKAGQNQVLRYHTLEQRVKEYWQVMWALHEGRAGEIPAGMYGEWVKV